jgi:hypothetical protein
LCIRLLCFFSAVRIVIIPSQTSVDVHHAGELLLFGLQEFHLGIHGVTLIHEDIEVGAAPVEIEFARHIDGLVQTLTLLLFQFVVLVEVRDFRHEGAHFRVGGEERLVVFVERGELLCIRRLEVGLNGFAVDERTCETTEDTEGERFGQTGEVGGVEGIETYGSGDVERRKELPYALHPHSNGRRGVRAPPGGCRDDC